MGLSSSTLASNMASTYTNMKKTPDMNTGTVWMDTFSTAYDDDANGGTFSLKSVVMSPSASKAVWNNRLGKTNGVDNLGDVISKYWSSQRAPGTAQILTTVSSVSNDADKIRIPIENYLAGVSSTVLSEPDYVALFAFIETQVKTIIWTVTETSPSPSSTSYPVTIS